MADCNQEVNQSPRVPEARLRRGPKAAPSAIRKPAGRAEGGDSRPLANRSSSSPHTFSSLSSDQKSDDSSPFHSTAHEAESRVVARAKAHHLRTDLRKMVDDIHKPLSLCGLGCKPGLGGQPGEISLKVEAGAARLSGTTRCSSPWSCPVCAPALADQRAIALQPQIEGMIAAGYTAWLMTLTVRHRRESALDDLFKMQVKAWAKVTSGKIWQSWRATGDIEYVRGFDCTHGEEFGWHPHIHLMTLIGPGHGDPEALAEKIKARWLAACRSVGLDALDSGQDVERIDDPARAARYAVSPAAVYEAHAMAKKRARGEGHGLTPMEILERAVDERMERAERAEARGVEIYTEKMGAWERLFREYVSATKGLHQCSTSRKLDLNPDREPEDTDAIDESKPDDTLQEPTGGLKLATLGLETMRRLDRKKAIPGLLQIAEFGLEHMARLREIERYLTGILPSLDERCDWRIVWPPASKEAAVQTLTIEERIRRRDAEIPM